MFTTTTKSIARADGNETVSLDVQPQPVAGRPASQGLVSARDKVRGYILSEILLGTTTELDDSASLLNAGILDSTGTMELIAFLEEQFGMTVFDSDIIADNLDSVDRICAFIERSRQGTSSAA